MPNLAFPAESGHGHQPEAQPCTGITLRQSISSSRDAGDRLNPMILRRQICRSVRSYCSHLPYVFSRPMASSSRTPRILPPDVLLEEERVPGYRPEFYYPANPGDVLNNRYKILSKLGWGSASTVWLAEDMER